ncbi:response regulator [Pseudanabaena sp. FACHB-1998]|uniref:response regulator n=1 Tax=Pseudanabaena sp. FACHB-1998 TaxID=2692858 RepID=UPI0016802BEE|nr:response regulator [Pseudanabaena sp. FACHB-1998]MBD2177325.1 response regulator [Pseudanabaena sp. FACHB-1998]
MTNQLANPLITLLIVDDSESDRQTYMRFLKSEEYRTYQFIETETLEDSLEIYRSQPLDMVLLDLNLPDGNGLEFLEEIRRVRVGRKLPVIMLTGQGDEKIAVRAMKLGAADYLVKDAVTATLLNTTVKQILHEVELGLHLSRSQQQLAEVYQSLQDLNASLEQKVEERTREFAAREAESRAILEAIPDLMFRIGANLVYRQVITSRPQIELFADNFDVIGHSISDILSPELAQRQHHYMQQALQTGELQVFEQQVTIGDRLQYEEVRIIKSGEDEAIFMIRDISDRKLAELKLRQLNQELEDRVEQRTAALKLSESRLQESQQIARLGNWEMDVVTGKIECSPELYNIFKIKPEGKELSYEILASYYASPDYQVRHELVTRAIRYGESYQSDFQIIRADGTMGYIFSKAKPVLNEAGQVTHLVGISMDISDRKLAEISLQESRKFIQTVIDTIPIPLFWKDRNSIYLGCNAQFASIFSLDSTDAMIGKNDFELSATEIEAIAYRNDDREVMESGKSKLSIVETLTLPDGKQIWLETHKSPLRDWANNVIGVVAMFQDITSRKLAEIQLQQSNEQLLHATKLKDEFLANMSHELRTPLNSILGMSEILLEQIFGELNPKQKKTISTIQKSGEHLLSLINDILDLSKISSGTMELNIEPVSVKVLCQSSIVFVQQQAFQKKIKVSYNIPSDINNIHVEERRIRQVLINLLTNAVKFTPSQGKIKLLVAVGCGNIWQGEATIPQICKLQRSPMILFQVVDTGIGIAAKNLQRLFQPFVQVDSALNREYEGTGLGLALVKKITELHGGLVTAESEVDKGSCFTVALPYEIDSMSYNFSPIAPNPLPESASISAATGAIAPLILLAEDNEINIETFNDYLLAFNYRVIIARDGEEAVAMAKEHLPDIILMDIQMPQMDGLQAIRLIRADVRIAAIPIIALTALVMNGDREICLAAGANEYLAKPVKLLQLNALIQKFL